MSLTYFNRIRILISIPFLIGHMIIYFVMPDRKRLIQDIFSWKKYRNFIIENQPFRSMLRLLVLQPEFRSQFRLRAGISGKILIFFKGGGNDLGECPNIGGGFVLMHGFGTVINGSSKIGENCTVLHGVTIGGGRGGSPEIGNNVYIGAGAIIIGKIKVGNNVKIGAGAIVVHDIPDDCTVINEKARIKINEQCVKY